MNSAVVVLDDEMLNTTPTAKMLFEKLSCLLQNNQVIPAFLLLSVSLCLFILDRLWNFRVKIH